MTRAGSSVSGEPDHHVPYLLPFGSQLGFPIKAFDDGRQCSQEPVIWELDVLRDLTQACMELEKLEDPFCMRKAN